MTYPVCIVAAGLGSRLEGLTQKVNKAMVEVAGKPAICRIIERFPNETRFVVAIGYKGSLLQEFLKIAYPSTNFEFVEVFPYEGPDSGLGLSLLRCEGFLQEPFIFTACDTLVDQSPPAPAKDWMGYSLKADMNSYRTLGLRDGLVTQIYDKMESPPASNVAYIGLAGIHHYDQFWRQMNELRDTSIRVGEVAGLDALIPLGVHAVPFGWHDTGTLASLHDARKHYKNSEEANILEKENEAIWFLNDEVIKYCDDQTFIKSRVARAKHLEGYVPCISRSSEHFYVYKKAVGSIFSSVVTPTKFNALLSHAENFWEDIQLDPIESDEFNLACFEFYKTKTDKRLEEFFVRYGLSDSAQEINGEYVPTLQSMLDSVDWQDVSRGIPSKFHGDFHFENILFNDDTKEFVYLDWRQD
ncbi:MAG: NTP transferase domain-containing protein, partial [Leptolyngbyaceae bacterium]|nr:NTP transferase domain-containing protein [Leptolyngbyaceae bacterium]